MLIRFSLKTIIDTWIFDDDNEDDDDYDLLSISQFMGHVIQNSCLNEENLHNTLNSW